MIIDLPLLTLSLIRSLLLPFADIISPRYLAKETTWISIPSTYRVGVGISFLGFMMTRTHLPAFKPRRLRRLKRRKCSWDLITPMIDVLAVIVSSTNKTALTCASRILTPQSAKLSSSFVSWLVELPQRLVLRKLGQHLA